jgi:hypothetical protein
MSRKITDAGVAGLPLHEGRAELLEEIMALDTTELDTDGTVEPRTGRPAWRRTGWVPVAAAAAVLAAVGAGVALPTLLDEPTTVEEPPAVAAGPPPAELAVLEVKGWQVAYAQVDENGGELSYTAKDPALDPTPGDGGMTLDIHWRSADAYDSYVTDREDIGPSEDIEVLGRPARLWAYAKDDHTAIREVVGDYTLEVRGSGLPRRDYLALLGQLKGFAHKDLDANLPPALVSDAERPGVIAEMLEPLPLPDGFDAAMVDSKDVTRYGLGADVTAPVACAWLEQWFRAREGGDAARVQQAVDAMVTSRKWPILEEMAETGGWSEVIWDFADQMAAGTLTRERTDGIGCPGTGSAEPAEAVG